MHDDEMAAVSTNLTQIFAKEEVGEQVAYVMFHLNFNL